MFYRNVLDRVKMLPGVQAAGAVNGVPLSGNINTLFGATIGDGECNAALPIQTQNGA